MVLELTFLTIFTRLDLLALLMKAFLILFLILLSEKFQMNLTIPLCRMICFNVTFWINLIVWDRYKKGIELFTGILRMSVQEARAAKDNMNWPTIRIDEKEKISQEPLRKQFFQKQNINLNGYIDCKE